MRGSTGWLTISKTATVEKKKPREYVILQGEKLKEE
jgi:hypothetical protein